jgi:hypothetical protein
VDKKYENRQPQNGVARIVLSRKCDCWPHVVANHPWLISRHGKNAGTFAKNAKSGAQINPAFQFMAVYVLNYLF